MFSSWMIGGEQRKCSVSERGGSVKHIGEQIHEQKALTVWQLRKLAKLLSITGDWGLHGQVCDLIKELTEGDVYSGIVAHGAVRIRDLTA